MANFSRKFATVDGSYTGGYTSLVIKGNENDNSNQSRGVVQVDLTGATTVSLQMRLVDDAPWFVVKEYTADALEEVVLAPQMRVVVSGADGNAEVWLAETH